MFGVWIRLKKCLSELSACRFYWLKVYSMGHGVCSMKCFETGLDSEPFEEPKNNLTVDCCGLFDP